LLVKSHNRLNDNRNITLNQRWVLEKGINNKGEADLSGDPVSFSKVGISNFFKTLILEVKTYNQTDTKEINKSNLKKIMRYANTPMLQPRTA
jgi:hypothetical protein